jgi:hypothetical protein
MTTLWTMNFIILIFAAYMALVAIERWHDRKGGNN